MITGGYLRKVLKFLSLSILLFKGLCMIISGCMDPTRLSMILMDLSKNNVGISLHLVNPTAWFRLTKLGAIFLHDLLGHSYCMDLIRLCMITSESFIL